MTIVTVSLRVPPPPLRSASCSSGTLPLPESSAWANLEPPSELKCPDAPREGRQWHSQRGLLPASGSGTARPPHAFAMFACPVRGLRPFPHSLPAGFMMPAQPARASSSAARPLRGIIFRPRPRRPSQSPSGPSGPTSSTPGPVGQLSRPARHGSKSSHGTRTRQEPASAGQHLHPAHSRNCPFDPVASLALLFPARPCGGLPAIDRTPRALFVPLSPRAIPPLPCAAGLRMKGPPPMAIVPRRLPRRPTSPGRRP